jgi:hypothetical protein
MLITLFKKYKKRNRRELEV